MEEESADAEQARATDAAAKVREAFRRVFPGVMVAMFLAAVDQTILASALPTIASALGGFADLSWVVVAYLLAAAIAAPLYGHLGDRFGRRRMLLAALAIFTLASLACALAPTLGYLIAARALQGLGGGGLMTLAQSLIGESVPPRERGRFGGYFAAVFALSSTSGPVLGAYLTEHVGWRAVFAINLPLGAIAAMLALRIPHVPVARAGHFKLDVAGTVLFAASTVTLLFALSSAGHRFAWTSIALWGLFAGAAVGYVALLWWERRSADPVIPIALLRLPAIARSDAVVVCFAGALFATVLYLPLYLQLGRGLGVGASGGLLLPTTLAMVASATIVGRLIARTGRVTLFPPIGLALATLALVLLAVGLSFVSTPVVLLLTVLIGVGLGMVMPPTQVIVQHAAGRTSLGAATGSIALSRSIGGAIGVAIVGGIVFAFLGGSESSLAATFSRALEGGAAYVAQTSVAERAALAAQLDYTFRIVFSAIAVITGGRDSPSSAAGD
jgi:EmrB/QacA subfamily drug resistance transporter